MRSRSLLLLSSAVLGALLTLPATAWGGGSVGSQTVYSKVEGDRAGRAVAFRSVASRSGWVDHLSVYIARSNSARRVELGLHRDRRRMPSALVARCVVRRPVGGRWNTCAAQRRMVIAGTAYWTSILQPRRAKGRLRYVTKRAGRSKVMRTARSSLKRLPQRRMRGRAMRRRGRASLYAHSVTPAVNPFTTPIPAPVLPPGHPAAGPPQADPDPDREPTPPSPTSTPTPGPTPAPTPTPGRRCFRDPSACDFPDIDNTGPSGSLQAVPGAPLPSGAAWDAGSRTLRITGNNVTVQNLDIPGPIAIEGNNATVRNSRIHVHSGCSSPCGSYGIRLGQSGDAVSGTVLQDLDLVTVDKSPANDNPLDPSTIDTKVDHGVRNNGDRAVTANGLYVKGFAGAWKGPGTIRDSYLFSQLVFQGDHVEAYLNGGEGNPSILEHNTILNPVAQTAAISFFNDFGGIGQVSVANNLLAGGGYVMYGGAKNGTGNVTGPIVVRDNHIARGNRDENGYFPAGGQYGVWAEFNRSATTSCGNVWDDNLAPAPAPASSRTC